MTIKSPKAFLYDEKLDDKDQFERMYRLLREDLVQNATEIADHEARITVLEP